MGADLFLAPPRTGSASGWKQLDRSHKKRHFRSLRNAVARRDSREMLSYADGRLLSLRYVATDVQAGPKQ